MNAWDQDFSVDMAVAEKLIRDQFPCLQLRTIDNLGRGFDNSVYLVNGEYTFRIPTKRDADELIVGEGLLLPIVGRHVSVRVPEPMFYGTPTAYYPYHFLGYRYLKGYGIERAPVVDNSSVAMVLARFLRELHSIPTVAVQAFAGGDKIGRADVKKRAPILARNVETLGRLGVCDTRALEEYLQNLPIARSVSSSHRLVHGDLHIKNLLFDASGQISAVIDFGDMHLGDVICDLAIAYSLVEPSNREEFFEVYGHVEEGVKDGARFRAVFTNVYLLLHAHDLQDARLAEMAAWAVANALR